MKSSPSRLILAALLAPALAHGAADDELAELRAMVRSLQKTVTDQNARIATLEKAQPKAGAAKTAGNSLPPSTRSVQVAGMTVPTAELPAPARPKATTPVTDYDTFQDLQRAAPRANNAPLDPELKGFIGIPGTDTIFRIGGSARVDAITDLKNNGNPNLFVPSSIPVPGQEGWDGGERSTIHGKGTRLSLELRRPVGENDLRIYSEFDFYDDSSSISMKPRLRHFYGQAWNFLIGQTFSAFMDADAFPDVVDYQGPNGIVNKRQPQIRYTQPFFNQRLQLFASIEQPNAEIDTSTDQFVAESRVENHIPDSVVGLRLEGEPGHVQVAGLFRELSFESDSGPSRDQFGWGVSMSGALKLPNKDKFSLQATYGNGVARYINDLSGQDLDAALVHDRLEATPVFATMAGYTHRWTDAWRSTVAGGFVQVDAPEPLGALALKRTFYGSANLMWHPTEAFRMGLEYLYGRKETQDGSERDAHRLDFVVRYDLVR